MTALAFRAPRGARSALVAAAVAAVCALLGGPAETADAANRPLWTGVTNPGYNTELAYQRVRGTGARFARVPLNWEETAPRSRPSSWDPQDPGDPNYNWRDSDIDVVNALSQGVTPVLLVEGAPRWAQRCATPSVLRDAICDPDPEALRSFAAAAARRYSGSFGDLPRVRYWQGLNEPNLSLFFFPQFNTEGKMLSPGLYRKLINGFYAGIKSVDRSNMVLLGGLGPNAVPKYTIGPMAFARGLLCMRTNREPRGGDCDGGVRFDIFAIQPYSTGGPGHEGGVNDVQIADLGKLQGLIRAADRAGRIKNRFRRTPLWITEFSWDSKPPDPGGLPTRILDRWVAEAMHSAWRAGVSHFFWYSLRDGYHDPDRPWSETLESGLYFRGATPEQDKPKQVRNVFRFPFVAYPGRRGLSFWGRTPTSGAGRVVVQAWRGKTWRPVAVVRASQGGVFRGFSRSRYGRNRQGAVRAFFAGEGSVPFAMRGVKDFRHAPFGDPVE